MRLTALALGALVAALAVGEAHAMCMKDDCSNDPDAWGAMAAGIGSKQDIAQTNKGVDALIAAKLPTARSVLDRSLGDYPSARFRAVRVSYGTDATSIGFCGEVNAKNAMGGYTGWRPFFLIVNDDPFVFVGDKPGYALQVVEMCRVQKLNTKDYSAALTYRHQ